MASVQDAISQFTPSFSGVGNTITILIYFLLFAIVGGTITFFLLNTIRYNKRVTIYENISGQGYVPIGSDRAMTIKISDAGEELLFLKKRKLYKGAYGKKIGKNHYAFAVGQDGYWYNITFGDLDNVRGELKLDPVDRDMRYTHEGIRKNVAMRFDKKNWLKENIGLLVGIISIVIVLIFMWLLADKYFTIFGAADQTLKSSKEILDQGATILANIDNICSGGTGLVNG